MKTVTGSTASKRWPWALQLLLGCALSSLACDTRVNLGEWTPDASVAPLPRPEPPTCTAQNCAQGCCENDTCVQRVAQSEWACGFSGAACVQCSGTRVCRNGACALPPAGSCVGCTGCCSNGFCRPGNTELECGQQGEACSTCDLGGSCISGACQACGPLTCSGCCLNGLCQTGTLSAACGLGGIACEFCNTGIGCQKGSCI